MTALWGLTLVGILAILLGKAGKTSAQEACKTYGSGITQSLKGETFYVRSDCPFNFISFTHDKVDVIVTLTRGKSGLISRAVIDVNNAKISLENGHIVVEGQSVSVPYNDMYQHIFQYGIYTKMKSRVLPATFSILWQSFGNETSLFWVELDTSGITDLTGFCDGDPTNDVLREEQCIVQAMYTQDSDESEASPKPDCEPLSYMTSCFSDWDWTTKLCMHNVDGYEKRPEIYCPFFHEIAHTCSEFYSEITDWRTKTNCPEPTCPGNLTFREFGTAFSPTCSSSQSNVTNSENIATCLCPPGTVLSDLEPGNRCVAPQNCPCFHNGQVLPHGAVLDERCHTCTCQGRDWICEKKTCPPTCTIEGRYVTTFDGKQYTLPGRCKYHAVGSYWTLSVSFSTTSFTVSQVLLKMFETTFTFSADSVKADDKKIKDIYRTENVTVFWQTSMYVQLHASTGMNLQVRVSPMVQLYLTLPAQEKGQTKGICGNYNNITTDEFISFTSYPESSSEVFAQSWAEPVCTPDPLKCIISQSPAICLHLKDPSGKFAACHSMVPVDSFVEACEQSPCSCSGNEKECLCVVLANYAQACAKKGEIVEGWRTVTNCMTECDHNQKFEYDMQACNRTCRSLSEPDPTCEGVSDPVEGCGCPEGTYLSENSDCVPRIECPCYYGGKVFSGSEPVEVNGQKCTCEHGKPVCTEKPECPLPKTHEHCSGLQRTCDALTKPMIEDKLCQSGCFCPNGQYEDHYGNCVPRENCSCVSGEKKYRSGDVVHDSCKICICQGGNWNCHSQECPGKCQVYGNGHYKTFDSKWYHFDGHCQYTLVEDTCGRSSGSFSITAESVPCCDAALTCARIIVINLKGKVTLTLQDMNVKENLLQPNSSENVVPYSVHTFGLYIEISIPSMGLTVIWDKNTRLTIIADEMWKRKVCGLCGNFDGDETNDLQARSLVQVTNTLEFGNSWKTATPPCSDAVNETFPCERFSYCAAWAEHRCKALIIDTFKACHPQVDPQYYLEACVKETCSCQFEGKFLGFCTAVAAYADACSTKGACVEWRTPDLCPVYCDYYNEKEECTWHYRACGPSPALLTCGKPFKFSESREGCYPQCPPDKPYFDEYTRKCIERCPVTSTTTTTEKTTTTERTTTTETTTSSTTETTPTISPSTTTETTTSSTTETTPTISPSTTTETTTSSTTETTPTISPSTTTETTTSSTTETTPTISPSTTTETTTSSTTETTPTISPSTTTETTTSSTTETTPTISPSTTTETTTSSTTETTPTISPSTTPETTTTIRPSTTTETTTSSTTETTPTISPSTTPETTTTIRPSTTTETTTSSTTETTHTITPFTTTKTTTSSTTKTTPTISPSTTTETTTSSTTETTPTISPSTTTETTTSSTTETTHTITPSTTTETTTSSTTQTTPTTIPSMTPTATTSTSTTITTSTTALTTATTPTTHSTTSTSTSSTSLSPTTTQTTVTMSVSTTAPTTTTTGCSAACPETSKPKCPRGLLKEISDGCCKRWTCDCQCDVYGDPHYITFQGTPYDFFENCTYILVKEKKSQYNFLVAVDNSYYSPFFLESFVKRVIMTYKESNVVCEISAKNPKIMCKLNGTSVIPPAENQGIIFQTTGTRVTMYMDKIRSSVTVTSERGVVVNVAMENFANNTEGQCGVCAGGSCVRKGGALENETCCPRTASSWVYNDTNKPHCQSREDPCFPLPPPLPQCNATGSICDILKHKVFSSCREKINSTILDSIETSCRTDKCLSRNTSEEGLCSSLSQAAEVCRAANVCVEWRHLTNGSCDISCSNGQVYQECRSKADDYCDCRNRVSGMRYDTPMPGCFCPGNMMRAEKYKYMCVPQCTTCKGPLGQPKQPGETWESNCNICTCNNITMTEECTPKPTPAPPTCKDNEMLVTFNSTDSCYMAICVEKTCEYNGTKYKVGDQWKGNNPCVSYSCQPDGVRIEERVCPRLNCAQALRKWDDQHCCYTCSNLNETCAENICNTCCFSQQTVP